MNIKELIEALSELDEDVEVDSSGSIHYDDELRKVYIG